MNTETKQNKEDCQTRQPHTTNPPTRQKDKSRRYEQTRRNQNLIKQKANKPNTIKQTHRQNKQHNNSAHDENKTRRGGQEAQESRSKSLKGKVTRVPQRSPQRAMMRQKAWPRQQGLADSNA